MIEQYFDTCFDIFIEDLKIDKILDYGEITVYKIEAANGLRYATVNEVAQGVHGLIPEKVYAASEDSFKKLALLEWTFYGKSHFFRKAGYKLNYDSDGNVTNTFYEMIQMCAVDLKELFDWVVIDSNYIDAINKIKKVKSKHGYKYSNYEKDEVQETITIKQLVYNIYNHFPRNSANSNYRYALSVAYRSYKSNEKLSPFEISRIRTIYDEYIANKGEAEINKQSDEIRELCETIEQAKYTGKINQNHFAFKIIKTLKDNNYKYCSAKQRYILNEALGQINEKISNENKDSNSTTIVSEDEIDSTLNNDNGLIGNLNTLSQAISFGWFSL